MILVVDYKMGNLRSIAKALDMVGGEVCISSRPEDIKRADKVVLPGVGSFGEGMKNLFALGLAEALGKHIRNGKPFLGICLGMQLLARDSEENGKHSGLNLLPASVKYLAVDAIGLKVPHMGWNEVSFNPDNQFFKNSRKNPTFYFVHSYRMVCDDNEIVIAECEYGIRFPAAVQKDNIFATQFHPEKSQKNGLILLENFVDWKG
jgi:glutamine amidotransferase